MSKKRRNKSRRKQRGTNRQYKDRLFKALFGSHERKDLTLALYNALRGSSYTNPQDIRLTTIDDVVYMGMKNDVSFLFDQVMNLWEQQSTPNPNMPFRFLLYYAHVMESYVSALGPRYGGIYSSALVQLPTPRIVLFYNGQGAMPEYLYLSSAYMNETDPDVELRVKVININSGRDPILELCRPLNDYTTFVEAFRRYQGTKGISSRTAASKAIAELPAGAVKQYLIAHRAEVVDMLLTEYDEERTLLAEYYAGERAGLERGEAIGALRTICQLAASGVLSLDDAIREAAALGVTDESDLRNKARQLDINL